MKILNTLLLFEIIAFTLFAALGGSEYARAASCPVNVAIVANTSSPLLQYAANELRQYANDLFGYQWQAGLSPSQNQILLTSAQKPGQSAGLNSPDGFEIRPFASGLEIRGNNDRSVLYGVYELVRTWGVQFYLSGDVIPSSPSCSWPSSSLAKKATLRLRGVHPYPDFLAGPTSWDDEQFEKYLRQLPKLGLNFFGIHQYTYEPYLDYEVDGVHPRSGHLETTATYEWGYGNIPACQFEIGRELFEGCVWGSQTALRARTPAERYELAEGLLARAFARAHELGLVTAFGFEPAVHDPEFQTLAKTPNGPQKIIEGRVRGVIRAFPQLDYLWLFSDETHQGDPATLRDAYRLTAFAEQLAARLSPGLKLMIGGWNVEPTLRKYDTEYNGVKFGRDTVFTSYGNYDPWRTVEQNLFRHFKGLQHDHAIAAWCEYDGRLLAGIQPNVTAYQAMRELINDSGSMGYFFLHWNTRLCDSNLDYLRQLGWSNNPIAARDYYRNYYRSRFAPANDALVEDATSAALKLEDINHSFMWAAQAFWLMADDWTVMGPWKRLADAVNTIRNGRELSGDDVNYLRAQLNQARQFQRYAADLDFSVRVFERLASGCRAECESAAFLSNRVAYFSAYLKNTIHLSLGAEYLLRANDQLLARQDARSALRLFSSFLVMNDWLETLRLYPRFIDDRGEKGVVVSLNQKILAGLRALEASLKGL